LKEIVNIQQAGCVNVRKDRAEPGVVVYAWSPSYSESWCGRITWAQFKTSLGNNKDPILKKKERKE
jgi:hypothetical protein